jgi:hypothetical protein
MFNTAYRGGVGVDRDEAARAARQRAVELNERITRLGTGQQPTPEDVTAGLAHLAAARQRLKQALLRSADAHRSAAATAVKAGRPDEAQRHLALADVDAQAVGQIEDQ